MFLTSKSNNYHNFLFIFLVFFLFLNFLSTQASGQRRDHLTEAEIELVRDIQQIDERMKIFVKAIDRRFMVLNNDTTQAKTIEKDSEKWGALPTGTRTQLLIDIEKLLEEAISKIDDVAERDMKSDYFPNAVHILADAAKKFLTQLKAQSEKSADEKENGAIIGAVERCNEIIEASSKVKRETPKEIQKRKDKAHKDAIKDS